MLVLVEQSVPELPVVTHVSVTVVNLEEKARFSVAYDVNQDGDVIPRQFSIYLKQSPVADPQLSTIKWRRNGGGWYTYPYQVSPDSKGEYYFGVAQRGPYKGVTYRTEQLDELTRGGSYVVTRLSVSGEELATTSIDFPNDGFINALYARARAKAITSLKPGCQPAGFVRPATGQ